MHNSANSDYKAWKYWDSLFKIHLFFAVVWLAYSSSSPFLRLPWNQQQKNYGPDVLPEISFRVCTAWLDVKRNGHAVKLLFKFVFWVISLDFTYIEHSVACGLYCFFLFLSVAHWYHLNRINSFYQKLDHMHEQVNSSSLKSVCIWSWKCI